LTFFKKLIYCNTIYSYKGGSVGETPFREEKETMELPVTEEKRWYVLNFIHKPGKQSPKNHIDRFNREGHDLELFAPVIRPAHVVNGKVRYSERLLTYFYVFVRGTFEEVKGLCVRQDNDFSILRDRSSSNRYAVVSDTAMESFRIIARAHTNTIPFFNIEDIELNEGDLVEVVGGDYDGLKGTFVPKSRSNKGNLVIAATAAMGAVLWDIDARCVRILEFAPDTRRQYDLVDSFIPKLLPVLRKFHSGESLTDREKSQLIVFNRRMGIVAPSNHKVEAKLLAVLMCVQFILGDMEGYRQTEQRFEKRRTAVTNPWTLALTELMMSVVRNDMSRLRTAYDSIRGASDKLTGTQTQLLEEFRHYIN